MVKDPVNTRFLEIVYNIPLFTNIKSAYYAVLAIKHFHSATRP